MSTISRCLRDSLTIVVAVSVVASACLLPEVRLPVMLWVLGVAVIWRPSPGSRP